MKGIKIERRSCCDRAENRCRAFGAGGSSLNACVTYTCGGTCGSTNFMKRFFKSKNNALTKTEKMSAKKRSDCCLVSKNRCPGSFAQCQAFMNYSCGGCF
ncbi:unnamed protein product [Owenia fusiformis]|uniref:Uncharacterized protein n=1 Tax=Owenia fusiformis TaxID=6347 RepID=A0A8J1XIK9_OWEFU|nr:unnamed protein product [Owenia fusiformis]